MINENKLKTLDLKQIYSSNCDLDIKYFMDTAMSLMRKTLKPEINVISNNRKNNYIVTENINIFDTLREGEKFFNKGFRDIENWEKGKNIPREFGPEMLSYLAWKCNFKVLAQISGNLY